MQNLKSFIAFAGFFALGLVIADHSWNGAVYVYVGEDRQPASVRTAQDYTEVPRHSLRESMQKQLLARATVERKEGFVGIQLGHPLLIMNGGGREFACNIGNREGSYDKIELLFTGSGVASNGEPPQMIVDALCASGSKVEQLQTIWIPMQEILKSEAKDQDLQVYSEKPVNIHLRQISGEWPETWVLSKVKMYRESAQEESVTVDVPQMRVARGSLLSFDYKAEPNRVPSSK